jgi:RNA polymerase sigma factor (sigma-70 family)
MDYSELVSALKENNTKKINKLVKAIRPRLIAFLRIHMNASQSDAKDTAQEALLITIESIRNDKVKNPDQIVKYMISVCRNAYLREQQNRKEVSFDKVSDLHQHKPGQLQSLLDKEQKKLLQWCMKQLKDEYRKYMQFWFDNPDMHTQKVAEHFDISLSNAWTRKHRLIKKLNECYQEKSKL